MASLITSVSHGNYPQQPKSAYITTANYSNVLYNYTTSLNSQYVTVGSLTTPATGVNSSNTPAGDYLYENGKKLYPGANPGISSFLVGVYSPVSGVSGYIDPNGSIFSPLQSKKPYQVQVRNTAGDYVYNADNTGVEDSGVPVLTNGSVLAGTSLGYKSSSYGTVTQGTSTTTDVTLNTPTGTITCFTQGTLAAGSTVTFNLINSSIEANDIIVANILPSVAGNNALLVILTAVVTAAGNARIILKNVGCGALTTGDTPAINFMILKN